MASFSGLPYLYKEGTLIKRQRAQHHKNNGKLKFQERYFQLKGDSLDYYDPKKKLSAPSKGSFQMRRAKIVESMPFGVFKKSNMFQVGDNTEVLYLVASSEFERDSWLKALIQCCEDCGNDMFTKFHPGVYGLTAKNHWSCCGGPREAAGCSMCQQLSKSKSADETDSPKSKLSSKSKPPTSVTSTPVIPKDTSTPEPQVMYINPLVNSHTATTDTTKVHDSKETKNGQRQSAISLDSGNGTGSTNSSRPQSQVIGEAHSNSDSPQLKSALTAASKENVHKVENKRNEDAPVEAENKEGTSGLCNSNNLVASNDGAKGTSIDTTNSTSDKTDDKAKDTASDTTKDITSDTTKDTTSDPTKDITSDTTKDITTSVTKDITSDTTKDVTSDTTKDTASDITKDTTSDITKDVTSDTTKDTTCDTVKDTVSNLETVQSKVVSSDTATDSISDITEDTVTNKAWLDKDEEKVTKEKPIDTKKNIDNLDLQNNFKEVEGDDVFVELPTPLRKSHFGPASPMSPNKSPRLSVGTCSPISMSPRPRRSSFSVTKALVKTKNCRKSSNPMNTNKDGYTQLHLACKNGDTAAIQNEIDMGADVEMETTSGTNPLKPIFLAFLHDHNQALEYLLVHCGANPSSTDGSNGASLLHWAAQRGNLAVVQLLIQNGSEVNKMDWKGNTPLFEASKNGHAHIVNILIKCGADVDIANVNNKRTALHEAAQFGHYEVAKLLVDHKASLDIRETVTNNTPAELASLHKHHEVYNLLVPSSVEDGAPYESLHVIPRAYPEGIAGVSFCDGNVLVIGSKDHQIGFWDMPGAVCKRTVQLDNTVLSIATHGTFVAIGSTTIRLLSSTMETWRRSVLDTDLDYEAIEEDLALHMVGFTPNGRLVTADVEDEDAMIKLWPVLSENLYLKTCQRFFSAAVMKRSTTYTMVVSSVPDSTVLAVVIQPGSLFNPKGNKLIRVYDWKACKCIQTIDTGSGGFDVSVVIRFSTVSANELAVACQGSVKVYNTDTAQVVASFSSGATVTSLAYSANGRHLCAGLESGAIQVFNLSSKAQQFALETQTSSISCMEFTPDGSILAVGTSDGSIELWKTNS